MESKLLTIILLAVILLLGYVAIDAKYLNPVEKETVVTDTVYVDVPFEVEVPSKEVTLVPKTLTFWEWEEVTIEKIEVVHDTVVVYSEQEPELPVYYSQRFFTTFTDSPKLLEIELFEDELFITGLRPDGQTVTGEWGLDLFRYTYRVAPDGEGWISVEENRQGPNWSFGRFELNPEFSHRLGVGYAWWVASDNIRQSPYVNYNPTLHVTRGVALEGNVWVSENIMGTLGVSYEF